MQISEMTLMVMRSGKLAAGLIALGALSACVSIKEHRGFVLDQQLVDSIQVGTDNKASVEKTLGRPSFTGQFNPNDWYYISQQTRQFAFQTPRIKQSTIVRVQFDRAGNVAAVQKANEKQIARVGPMKGKTPTLGQSKSLIEEVFGNIGTISQPGLPGGKQ